MITQTAIPLPSEYGATVTTAKIARATGIGGSLGHRAGKHPGTGRGVARDESAARIRAASRSCWSPIRAIRAGRGSRSWRSSPGCSSPSRVRRTSPT